MAQGRQGFSGVEIPLPARVQVSDNECWAKMMPRISVAPKQSGAGEHPAADAPRDERDDQRLVTRVAQGDEAAFRILVGRHLSTVLGVARRMLRSDAEAEDIAQETLLRLWRSADRLVVPPGGLRPWLCRVAANLSIDKIRGGRNEVVTDEVPEVADPAGQLVGLERRDTAARVEAALQRLPERQRLALTLFHYEGLSQIEVASIMGISDEAVESLLARARRSLKGTLAGEWREMTAKGGG